MSQVIITLFYARYLHPQPFYNITTNFMLPAPTPPPPVALADVVLDGSADREIDDGTRGGQTQPMLAPIHYTAHVFYFKYISQCNGAVGPSLSEGQIEGQSASLAVDVQQYQNFLNSIFSTSPRK
jgi:hypothetical protein